MTQDWEALATEVRKRREKRRLPIDLSDHGGPTEMTVRKIESGGPVSIRPRTKVLLERALQWPPGLVDEILDGTATQDEIDGSAHPSRSPGELTPIAARLAALAEELADIAREMTS